MQLSEVVQTSEAISATRSRKRKSALLAQVIREAEPSDLPIAIAYLSGQPRQDRLDLGWAALRDTDVTPAARASLELKEVDATLEQIATVGGPGSRTARLELLADLLSRATADEQRFLRGLILRELRQGALDGIAAQAVARATDVDDAVVRHALMVQADLGEVALAAREGGEEAVAAFRLKLFRPLQPMLATTSEGVVDALTDLGEAVAEQKLDGARIQVHREGEKVRVYTRNLRDVTDSLPDLVAVAADLPVGSVVLDGEALAIREDGRPQPFQVTMSRFGRSADIDNAVDELPLVPFFFDCLHLDGEDLLDRPTVERLAALGRAVPNRYRVDSRLVADEDEATEALREALDAGHEGLMLKALDAPYEAGRRGAAWRKVKPVHTLDLVVLAAEWGSGRRKGWLSNLHLGAYDPDADDFVMLGKTFKGLTDDMLEWQTQRFLHLQTRRDGHIVHVRPEQVVEIAFDGVQESSRYPAGMALRFARVRGYRHDKGPREADTVDTVRAIHRGERRPGT